MNIKRVVVWGHFTGSHSFIHAGYYKAFKYMGYETHWINNIDELGNVDLSGTLFLTEDQAKHGMPIRSDCYYVLHHMSNDPFISAGCKVINLCNYLHTPLKDGGSYNYPLDNSGMHGRYPLYPVEKVNDYVYYDKRNLAIYQPWATNLLPSEIIDNPIPFDESKREINFIGSIWQENILQILPMLEDCKNRGININIYGWLATPHILSQYPNIKHISTCGGATEEQARELVKSSLIYPEVRGEHHRNLGYIPCRLFKNISYGCIPCTNSLPAYEFFEKLIPYSDNTGDFLEISINYLKNRDIEKDRYLMNKVKTEHTYVNRAEELIKYFDVLYS